MVCEGMEEVVDRAVSYGMMLRGLITPDRVRGSG
jgi:hypothetical protein